MKQFLKNIGVGFISLILMLVYVPTAAFAAENGTITVHFTQTQFPIPDGDVDVTLCRIADYSEQEGFTLTESFADCGYSISEIQAANASEMLIIAETLQTFVKENEISGSVYEAAIEEDEKIANLQQGVYLLMISDLLFDTMVCNFSPVLCFIPSVDAEGLFCHEIAVTPKYVISAQTNTGVETAVSEATETTAASESTLTTTVTIASDTTASSSTGSSTTDTDTERLPQTGPLMWVVYILAGVGLICLITVWGIGRKDSAAKKGKITFLILGFGFLAGAGWICGDSYLTERSSADVMSAALKEIKATQPVLKEAELQVESETSAAEETDEENTVQVTPMTFEVDGNQYIGILEIPSLSLELPIASDCSMQTLKKSPGCYAGLSGTSDLVIGAHNFASHFGSLHSLTADSDVTFTDINGNVYRYRVTEVTEVSPTQVDAVCESEHDLALFTCNSSGARRVVAFCDAI